MSLADYIKELYPPYKDELARSDAFGDEKAVQILKNKDLKSLRNLFALIPSNWADRYFYSLAVSRRFPLNLLKKWVKSEPESADAHLVYGARLLKWSWDARGYGRGATISKEKWREFYRRLDLTRDVLESSIRLHPDDPTPWSYLIMVGIYSQYGQQFEQTCFEEAVARYPECWIAHMHRLTGLSEKYGGSHDEMFNFANEVAAAARPGSLLPALLIKAQSEYWKYLHNFDQDLPAAEAHLTNEYARSAALRAYTRTLGSYEYDHRESIFARINAAGWFCLVKNKELLKRELIALDGCLFERHWNWVGILYEPEYARELAGLD